MTATSRRAKLIRYAKRGVDAGVELDAILDEGFVAHVGFAEGDQPFVLPMTYLYRDGRLFLHGSRGSRTLKHLGSGAPVCVTVTLLDALIASKAASSHSMNYRSVVVFGRGKPVRSHATVVELSHAIIARYFADRKPGEAYRPVTDEELKSARFVEIEIEELSGKRRTGGPINDLDSDPHAVGWNGVLPVPPGR